MRKDITNHVKKCVDCQKYKPANYKPAEMLQNPIIADRFKVLAMDLIGPLPQAESLGYLR